MEILAQHMIIYSFQAILSLLFEYILVFESLLVGNAISGHYILGPFCVILGNFSHILGHFGENCGIGGA